jgi:hypothetical protein
MKCVKYRGDKTGDIRPNDILGPDAHGLYHIVTGVQYEAPFTIVETRKHAGNQRVRYYGGVNNPPPPQHDSDPVDTIEAK